MDTEGPYAKLTIFLIVLALIILNALINMIFSSLTSLNHQKLRDMVENGDEKAKDVLKISQDQQRLMLSQNFQDAVLSIFTMAYLLLNIQESLRRFLNRESDFMQILIIIFMIIVFVVIKRIFANMIPQRIGIRNPYIISKKTAGFAKFILFLTKPFVSFVNKSTNLIMNVFGIESKAIEKEVTAEQIKSIVQVGEDQGVLRPLESKMINSIMEFDDVWAEEIMTARPEVFMIDIKDRDRKYLDEFIKLKHSRIPVYDDEVDNILGIIYTKDYLLEAIDVGIASVDIRKLIKPAFFVPEKIETDKLFSQMQKDHTHMAILIDEYGGFSGIVTMEDLVEEIVGDMDDTFDKDLPDIRTSTKGSYIVKGSTSIKDLNDILGLDIDEENDQYDTVGGFIIDKLGFIPDDDCDQAVNYKDYEFKILYIEDTRIKIVRIKKLNKSDQNLDENIKKTEKNTTN
ncbi:MAG: hemolysin family protein [Anaerococcus hydrogenalis]|uniref:hemolysin family protein n=1 Tax=Anaerococcus hydrogenalis TaxID=33029 RepID=UPI00290EB217|nr:hemolysin family protein [Anaerococcus hydrogenalis]MDU3687116.1 hemolysin family protein [Anaerococcus hydrogenalis]